MENKLDIVEIARKAILLGLGAVSLTKEKAEELIQELVQKGEVSQSEARELVTRMMERGKDEEIEIRRMFRTELDRFIAEMNVVSRKDYEDLEARLARLEEKLATLLPEEF